MDPIGRCNIDGSDEARSEPYPAFKAGISPVLDGN